MKGTRKALTFILSLFMAFSLCMTVGAETSPTMTASQNENGDLVIEITGDGADELAEKIYKGNYYYGYNYNNGSPTYTEYEDNYLYLSIGSNWTGTIQNGKTNKNIISKNGNKLTISNTTLKNGDFANGEYKIEAFSGGNVAATCNVTLSNLNAVSANNNLLMTLETKPVANSGEAYDGQEVRIKNSNNVYLKQGDDYTTSWYVKGGEGWDSETIHLYKEYNPSTQEWELLKFEDGNEYLFVISVNIIPEANGTITKPTLTYDEKKYSDEGNKISKGATGGSENYDEASAHFYYETIAEYIIPVTAAKAGVVAKDTDNKGTAPDGIEIKNTSLELEKSINLTDNEKAALNNGKKIDVQLAVSNKEEDINKTDATKVEEKVKELGLSSNVGVYNITLSKKIADSVGDATPITETASAISINFPLEDKLVNKDSSVDREYYVIRVHDSVAEKIDATYNEKTKSITFKTDKFSTYAIAYKDTKKPVTSSKSYDSKDKNQDGVIDCSEEMNSNNWVWSNTKKACVYKVSNTSTK